MKRLTILALTAALFTVAACGGNSVSNPMERSDSSGFSLSVEDASGLRLADSAAVLDVDGSTVEIYATDPAAVGFVLGYNGAALRPLQVERGERFNANDLFIGTEAGQGTVIIGGRDLGNDLQVFLDGPQLVARVEFEPGSSGRTLSAVPTANNATQRNLGFTDVGDGTATLTWDYYNLGDYDQNSEVGLSDISPIALYFQAQQGDLNWSEAQVADGDENGEVNTADLTSIAVNFQSTVTGCKVEESSASNGPWTELATVLTADGISDPLKQFEYNFTPQDNFYYRVRAYSVEDESQGPATDPVQISLLPPGDNPVAIAGSDVTSGDPPLTVNFFDDGSYDNDGTIVKWEWDFEGDGSFEEDATGTSGTASHAYISFGTYNARLRVTDNDGRMGVDTQTINVTNPDPGSSPEARAYALPDYGWAPLTVYTSPLFSEDPDGTITAWEWDMDGNGSYETDATASQGYAETTLNTPGEHTLTLRITDNDANYGYASVNVTVLDPAVSSVDYPGIFDDTQVRRIDFTVSQANWDAMWVNPDAELEVEADAMIFGDSLPQIGFRMKGNSSLHGPGQKKPWKVDTNEFVTGQEFRNTKTVTLNNGFKDASLAREIMAYKMMRFAGVPAGFATYAEVWITIGAASPEYWGVYTYVEHVDKKFIENRFGDDSGNLYKGELPADLVYYGPDIASYPLTGEGTIPYSKETNSAENDYTDIINLMDVINNSTPAEFPAALEAVFDVDDFLRYQAVTRLFSNADVYSYMSQNYYLYNSPDTGRFQWIPWDLNESWGQFGPQDANLNHPLYERGNFGGPGPGGPRDAPLTDNVFAVQQYREDFAAYCDLLLRNWYNEADMAAMAKGYRDLIDPYITQATGDKMEYSYSDFQKNWDVDVTTIGVPFSFGIGNFTGARVTYANNHLWADL